MARKVVTPAASGRHADPRARHGAQTITLSRTLDTELPGRYGLFTTGSAGYIKLGSVLSEDAQRQAQAPHACRRRRAARARGGVQRLVLRPPEQLHLPFTPELIGSRSARARRGSSPPGDGDTWVIQVHGRGTTRAECLRAVPVFHERGITTLVVSYRNDGEAPRSRTGTYALGATEWRDVDAAVGFARRRGAEADHPHGVVDGRGDRAPGRRSTPRTATRSPGSSSNPRWSTGASCSEYQARARGVPAAVSGLAIGALQTGWAAPVTRAGGAIPFDRLDVVARAAELRHPILILHSDDDGFVPSDASHDLVAARPDLVEMKVFEVARHTKLWNYDQERWSDSIRSWVRARTQPRARSRR